MFYFWTLSVKHHFPVSLTQNQWRQEFSLRSTVIGCTENSCHGQLLSSSLMYDSKWSSSRAQYMLWEIWGLWSLGEYSKRVIHDNCINHPHITHPRTNEWKPNGKSIENSSWPQRSGSTQGSFLFCTVYFLKQIFILTHLAVRSV